MNKAKKIAVASMCYFDGECLAPFGEPVYLNPYQNTEIIEAAMSRYIQLDGKYSDLFVCGDFDNDPIVDINDMVSHCGLEYVQHVFDELFQKSEEEIIELYFKALEEHDKYELFTLKRDVDYSENQIVGFLEVQTEPISLQDIIDGNYIDTSFTALDVEEEAALFAKAEEVSDMFYKNYPSIDASEEFEAEEKGIATFVRWLDAYIDEEDLYPVETLWNFETSGYRQVAVEGLQPDKTYSVSQYLDNATAICEKEITSRYYSGLGRSNYGLLVNVRKSTFVRIYDHDVFSGPEDDGKLSGFNTDGTISTSDIYSTRALCRSVQTGYTEAFFQNPSYCAIVIKKPIEEMDELEASRVTQLIELTGLPVVNLTRYQEEKIRVKDGDFELSFKISSFLQEMHYEKLSEEILAKLDADDKYEEFVEDIEEDEED